MTNWLSPNPFERRETEFKHLLFGTRFKFVDPASEGLTFGREDWTWVKTGHKTYRSPLSPPGRKYERHVHGDARVVPEMRSNPEHLILFWKDGSGWHRQEVKDVEDADQYLGSVERVFEQRATHWALVPKELWDGGDEPPASRVRKRTRRT